MATLQIASVTVALVAALANLIRRQWLVNIIALALQYLAVFVLLIALRPPLLALIKLLVGWMVVLLLLITLASLKSFLPGQAFFHFTPGEIFRAAAGIFIIFTLILTAPNLNQGLFASTPQTILISSLGLIFLGLLQLGMISEPLYIIIGLLTFLSGFELLYASLEFSSILEALFAAVNLGLALIGAYFLVKQEESQTV
jgi:hypothetical protein